MKTNLLLFTLFCTLLSFTSCKDVEAFKTRGIEVNANVEGIKTKRKKKKVTNYLQLAFYAKSQDLGLKDVPVTPQNGEYTTIERYITKSEAKKYKAGDKVAIVYLPEDPKNIMFKEDLN
ncbi:MAG: hypothetical protein ACPG49_05940 [Chitinophagales bacterium]